jgi:glutamate-5-semialdehyde dehydrogenase
MSLKIKIKKIAEKTKSVSYEMLKVKTEQKNNALLSVAEEIEKNRELVKKINEKDVKLSVKKKMSSSFIDRLTLTDKRINQMVEALKEIVKLKDPVGEITSSWERPNGMKISKMRMPLGVIGIIYESRPDVTVEASALTIKSGNCIILRGGSEAFNTNSFLVKLIKKGLKTSGLSEGAVEFIPTTDRKAIKYLLELNDYIDVIIPRGGKALVEFVASNSKIPVIYHDAGVCHIYVDEYADLEIAKKVCFNAKVQRPATCNAMETMLLHYKIAEKFLPDMAEKFKNANVELRVCKKTKKIIKDAKIAKEKDFYTEYNDLILNIKIVSSIDEAINHINKYGTHHSDAIITKNNENAEKFLKEVDSAACFLNASTRLHDGFEFGLGAEMGISNHKIHIRGPLALEGLTSEKYIIYGTGQIRE